MKKVLSAFCLLIFASTLTYAQEYPFGRQQSPNVRNLPRHHQQPQQRHYVCSSEYKPVCGRTRQNIVVTYSNQCFAEQDGAHVVDPTDACPPISCPATYEPVCARRSARGPGPDGAPPQSGRPPRGQNRQQISEGPWELKPYFNDCAAKQDGAVPLTIFSDRKQRHVDHRYVQDDIINFASVCPKTCPGRIELVCGEDESGKLRLYANRCSAVLEGAMFIKRGVCAGR